MNVAPKKRIAVTSLLALGLLTGIGTVADAQMALAPRGPVAGGGTRVASVPGRMRSPFRYGAVAGPRTYRPTSSYVPPHERAHGYHVVSESPELIEGTVASGPVEGDVIFEDGGGCADGSCGACGHCGHTRYIPCPTFSFRSLTIMSGVQGFKNGGNRGSDGSFGFQQGMNWTTKFACFDGLNAQLGFRGTQTDLAGSAISTDSRNQIFATAGLFRRVDWGWQFGAVVDFLREDWYTEMNISQVRGEVSWVFPVEHEIGFRLTQSTNLQTSPAIVNINGVLTARNETWEATDTYSLFYRYTSRMVPTATGQFFVGLSNESDTLFGGSATVPLTSWVGLQSEFTYLLPQDKVPAGGNPGESEGWNVGFGLVFYPGGRRNFSHSRYDRPLFDVANNGSFITDRQRP